MMGIIQRLDPAGSLPQSYKHKPGTRGLAASAGCHSLENIIHRKSPRLVCTLFFEMLEAAIEQLLFFEDWIEVGCIWNRHGFKGTEQSLAFTRAGSLEPT